LTSAPKFDTLASFAGVAQLVERNLAKVEVESSRLFSRSSFERIEQKKGGNIRFPFSFCSAAIGVFLDVWRCFTEMKTIPGGVAEWLCSGLQSRGRRFDSDPRLQPH
jgi:hypothetical protein